MADTVRLPGGRLDLPRIGVGCAYLTEGFTLDQDRHIVDVAIEAGARHFDVAPSYGMGTAEAILGRALSGRRQHVSIATKVGQPRNEAGRLRLLVRAALAPTRRLRRQVVPARINSSTAPRQLDFSSRFVEQSIVDSLRQLQTDYVDVLFLHEVTPGLVTSELVELLQRQRHKGTVRALGLATSPQSIERIQSQWPDVFEVVQHHWSVLDPPLTASSACRVTHRSVLRALMPLQNWLATDKAAQARLSAAVDSDLTNPKTLPSLLLGAAMDANPGGLVLVASRDHKRTRTNIAAAMDESVVAAGKRFTAALALEKGKPILSP